MGFQTVDALLDSWIEEAEDDGPCDVEWALNRGQGEAFTAEEKEVGYVAGGGGGKTWLGARWLIVKGVQFPEAPHMATANSYTQLHDVVVPELLSALDEARLEYKHRAQMKRIEFEANGKISQIRYRSMDNFNLQRGQEIGCAWMDEIRDTKPQAMKVIRTRMRHKGVPKWARQRLSTTTPNGFDFIHQTFVEEAIPGFHRLVRSSARENPFLPPDYIADLELSLDATQGAQEIDGEFVAAVAGMVYSHFNRFEHIRAEVEYDPEAPIVVCCDFNVDPMAWVLVQHFRTYPDGIAKDQWQVFDEITNSPGRIQDNINTLVSRYGDHKAGFVVTGDPADPHNHVTSESDWEAMLSGFKSSPLEGVKFHRIYQHPAVKDRVNSVNAALLNYDGDRRLFISPKCEQLKYDFEQVQWNEARRGIDKSEKFKHRTHWSDALGYYLHTQKPQVRRRPRRKIGATGLYQ